MTASAVELGVEIAAQPDEQTCGPTAFQAVYQYHGDTVPVEQVVRETTFLPRGGTLAVYLGLHALHRGYQATIHTCNVNMFDPTWFTDGGIDSSALCSKLRQQYAIKGGGKRRRATDAYCDFLMRGGELRMQDITLELLGGYLRRGMPILAGLSATWLYRAAREREEDCRADDLAGEPLGHFVVLHGVDEAARQISVADPYVHTPHPGAHHYVVDADRVIGAIYLGIVTYDAKLLVLQPTGAGRSGPQPPGA